MIVKDINQPKNFMAVINDLLLNDAEILDDGIKARLEAVSKGRCYMDSHCSKCTAPCSRMNKYFRIR